MIWVAGQIVRDDELKVSVLDRTFEHGLGLFETLRTWGGRAVLLPKHLQRMRTSAEALDLPLDPDALPDETAVEALLRAECVEGDVLLRITMSGGRSASKGAVVWMRALPLPPPLRREGAVVAIGDFRVVANDLLVRHKVLNYWTRRLAFENARKLGFDEALSMTLGWNIWEGSRTNLFLVERDTLITPSTKGPIVPGIMRSLVLEIAEDLPLAVRQPENLTFDTMYEAQEVFLTNSVRGIIPVSSAHYFESWPKDPRRWPVPGPWTQRLSLLVADRLNPAGGKPA